MQFQSGSSGSGGGASISTATPIVDGTATAGVATDASAGDHVHPTDTSRAATAGPTFTGVVTLPTGTVATTQSASDNSTKLATTAYTDTADALKANLAAPTFTGVVTLPTGTVATTQSAADSTTKLATTAFVTTADNLKANLAGPTFTGVVTLPTGTVATTQSAADGSTKLATTAYADTADALKANLASPTLTGTPAAPTAAQGTSTTQIATTAMVQSEVTLLAPKASPTLTGTPLSTTPSANTNTTQIATTAFGVAQAKLYGASNQIGPATFATAPLGAGPTTSSTSANTGDGRWVRVMMAASGTLHDVSFLTATQSGNFNVLVLDDGQANGTHTVRTCLYIKGSTSVPAAGAWMTGDAGLTVAAGDTLVFMITFDNTTAACITTAGATGAGTLPNSSFFAGSGASTNNQTVMGTALSANIPTTTSGAGSTITNANMVAAARGLYVVWRIS